MSASYRLQYPDAKLIIKNYDNAFEMMTVSDHVMDAMAFNRAIHHRIHGPDGLIVDKTMRDSYMITPLEQPYLIKHLDQVADTYWRNNFKIEPGSRLVPTLNACFYYTTGNGMCLHADDHRITTNGLVHSPESRQILSLILYCNVRVEGGELVFPKQGLEISPQAGMLVMFPSNMNFPHKVNPIISGHRISYQRFYSLAADK